MTVTESRWCPTCREEVVPAANPDDEDAAVCPTCGTALVEAPPKAPWHFKVLLVGTIGYLIYRLIWFIGWIRHHG